MAPFSAMEPLPTTIDRFEVRESIHGSGSNALYVGADSLSGQQVVIQIVRIADGAAREKFLATARALGPLHHPSLAPLVASGVDGDNAYAVFKLAPESDTLESFLSGHRSQDLRVDQRIRIVQQLCLGLEYARQRGVSGLNAVPGFIVITLSTLDVQIAGLIAAADPREPSSRDDVYAMPASADGTPVDERRDVYTLTAVLVELLTGQRPQRTLSQTIDLAALRSVPQLELGSDLPMDLAGFRRKLEGALARLVSAASPRPMAREEEPPPRPVPRSAPAAVPAEAPATPIAYDENVQFTVYRPKMLERGKWHPLLAFAHLSERRPDAPTDEPDPTAEVARQASALLGDLGAYRQSIEDSDQGVPRDEEITFAPSVPGLEFNPSRQSFLWTESVHRAEFRVRAPAGVPSQILHGRMSVYLGAILLAEINLSFGIGQPASSRAETVGESGRPYRRIFASYSHRDDAIVRQCWDYAKAMGDEYLQDVINLRSGEKWVPALEKLIRDADVFQLFWSWNALQSVYVQNEWQYALGLRRTSFIRPVYWDEPLPARDGLPPKDLLDLHFQRISSWGLLTTATSIPPSASDTGSMSRPEWLPEVPSMSMPDMQPRYEPAERSAPMSPPSSGIKWKVLSAVAAVAIVVLMLPTLRRGSSDSEFPINAAPAGAPSAPTTMPSAPATRPAVPTPVIEPWRTALSVVVATEDGPVLNAGAAVQVQLIDSMGNEIAWTQLNPDGTADFSSIPPGDYTIEVTTRGLGVTGEGMVSVAEGPKTTQRVMLRQQMLERTTPDRLR